MAKAPKKYKYLICRRMIDDSWEFNEFYLNKGIAAKEAIEESAVALFASLECDSREKGPSDPKEVNKIKDGPKDQKDAASQNKKAAGQFDSNESNLEDTDKEGCGATEGPKDRVLCAILFYDRSEKGTGFLPINIAYKDPYEDKGMLMEGCKSKYTDRFFKKLTDETLSRILAKEAMTDVPRAFRPNVGYNTIDGPSDPREE